MPRKFFFRLIFVFIAGGITSVLVSSCTTKNQKPQVPAASAIFPDTSSIPLTEEGNLIRYGRKLVAQTAFYFGPKGKIAALTSGMNCQNCHLDAGTKAFANNFFKVASSYPKFKERSGAYESIEKKVNDCFERSLNGKTIDTSGKEMKAFVAYIKWVGSAIIKDEKLLKSGTEELPVLDKAADTVMGKKIYLQNCAKCHGNEGNGVMDAVAVSYIYPPLWGMHSYNNGASIYRISKLAGYIKNNMPFGVKHDSTVLTTEEAWHVAAYINSQPHPHKDVSKDWPVLNTKPFDYPFGPYASTDTFSEKQHKYGPFASIKAAKPNVAKK